MDRPKQVLTLREVAEYLNVHISTIYKYAQQGKIPAFKVGSDWRFKKDDIDAWIKGEKSALPLQILPPPKEKTESVLSDKTVSLGIAVVGLACRYPGASNPKELWENILARRVQFRRMLDQRLPLNDYYDENPKVPDKTYATKAALIDNFEFDWSTLRIPKKTFESSDIAHWLALDIALKAFEDAGYKIKEIPIEKTGVVLGNTLTGEQTRSQTLRIRWPYIQKVLNTSLESIGLSAKDKGRLASAMEKVYKSAFYPITEDSLAGGLANTIAGRICNYLNFKGGGYIVDGACSSSLLAVATAANALKNRDLDLVLAGGVDISLDPFELVGFAKAGALAKEQMCVYDKKANGFIPGEGCGFVVLKRLEDAIRDKNYIYAVIKGWGISSDGRGGIMEPSASGQAFAIKRAYEKTGYSIKDCNFIEGHGTGTAKGDYVELEGIAAAIGDTVGKDDKQVMCGVTSFKSIVGHTKAAAGIGGLLKAIMAVNQRILPPTANCKEPNEIFSRKAANIYPILDGIIYSKDRKVRGGVSSAGFGGINCHVALESWDPPAEKLKPAMDEYELLASSQESEVFVFASRSFNHLKRLIQKFKEDLRNISMAEMADLSARLNLKVKNFAPIKVAVVTDNPQRLYEALCLIEQELASNPPAQGQLHRIKSPHPGTSISLSHSFKKNRIGFLYPGQASQRLGMTRMLIQRYSWARDLLKKMNVPIEQYLLKPNGKFLSEEERENLRKKLSETQITQPAVCFSSLVWSKYLSLLGVEPQIVGGHSLGEISAFYKGGAYKEEELLRFAEFRGEVMAAPVNTATGMMSLHCSYTQAQKIVTESQDVVIANINGPQQTIISGAKSEIDNVVKAAQKASIHCTPLAVSNAFHSRFMREAAAKIKESKILPNRFQRNGIGVYSCIDGIRINKDINLREYFAKQTISPVNFVGLVKSMNKACDLYIEVGPGRVLSDLVQHINKNHGPMCLAVEGTPNNDRDFNCVLAELFVRNVHIQWRELYTKRLICPFVPVSRRKFIVNQCEKPLKGLEYLPKLADNHLEFVPEVVPEVEHAPQPQPLVPAEVTVVQKGADPITDVLIDLVHNITGFVETSVSMDLRLLDDLNMDSIKAAELIAEATKILGIPGEIDPSQLSNSRLKEIRDEFASVLAHRQPMAVPAARPQVNIDVDFSANWVRNFAVQYVEEEIEHKEKGALSGIKKLGIVCEPSERALSGILSRELNDLDVDVLPLGYDNVDRSEEGEFSGIDGLIVILSRHSRTTELNNDILKRVIERLHGLAHGTVGRSAEKEKILAFVQFSEKGEAGNIESACARAFASTWYLERPEWKTLVIDFDEKIEENIIVEKIIDELQTADKFSLAGYDQKAKRYVPVYALSEPRTYSKRKISWSKEDVVLVTGGAKGITAECAFVFARKTRAKMVLVGRSPDPADLSDERNEIVRTLKRFKTDKLNAYYCSCDVTDRDDVEKLIARIKKEHGAITGFIHGAGLINLRQLGQGQSEEIYEEARPKVMGAVNICRALENRELKLVAALTSIIGVTGLKGSGWYGLANEMLNLYLNQFKKEHKNIEVIAMAYSIWDEVGMGVRLGSVDILSHQGIKAIPRLEGVKRFMQLVESDPGVNQVIITARMAGLSTWRSPKISVSGKGFRFIENVEYFLPGVELVAKAHLNVKDDPYLLDHNWKGSLLFPLVFGLEAMAQATACVMGVEKFENITFRDVKLERPISVSQEHGTDIKIRAEILEKQSFKELLKVKVAVYAELDNFAKPYFSAIVETGQSEKNQSPRIKKPILKGPPIDLDLEQAVYGPILFQGKMFRCIDSIYKLYYQPENKKGECLFDAEYYRTAWSLRKISDRFKDGFLIGDPFFIDLLFQSMQLIIPQDISLPNHVENLEIKPLKHGRKKEVLVVNSGIRKIDGQTYIGRANTLVGQETIVDVCDCTLKVLQHLPNNPTANDLVNATHRDENILRKQLDTLSEKFGFMPPVIKCLYDYRIMDKKEVRHRIEIPIIKSAVNELLGKDKRMVKDFKVTWTKSGKPIIKGKNLNGIEISLSHNASFLMVVAGREKQACDIEIIQKKSEVDWIGILGKDKKVLFGELRFRGFDINESATIVWGANEVVKKLFNNKIVRIRYVDKRDNMILLEGVDGNHVFNIVTFLIQLTRGGKRVVSIAFQKKNISKEKIMGVRHIDKGTSLLKEMGYNEESFKVKLDYCGPQDQLVFIKRHPITFKTNKQLSRRVYFTSYFDWMGDVREQSANPIMDYLSGKLEKGNWGIATKYSKLQILGELKASDVLETHFWSEKVDSPISGTYDLCIDWKKIMPNQSRERVAFSRQGIVWVKVISRGQVKIGELPNFIEKFMDTMKPRRADKKPLEKLPEGYRNLTRGRELISYKHRITNKVVLDEKIVNTTLEHSNLIGNIYFSNYAKWLGETVDLYFYKLIPEYYKGLGENGELDCLKCQIDHLSEGMPFDDILVRMYLDAVYERGLDLIFDFYLLANKKIAKKLAVARHELAWIKRDSDDQVRAEKLPKLLIDQMV